MTTVVAAPPADPAVRYYFPWFAGTCYVLGALWVYARLLLDPGLLLLGVLSLAGTAGAWYFVFSRHLARSRVAALLAGALCGFGPGMIAHSPADPRLTVQVVVPFLVRYAVDLAVTSRPARTGAVLGLLVTCQALIGSEMLLLTAIGGAILTAVYAMLRRPSARAAAPSVLRGLAVAGGLAAVLLAYPIWLRHLGRLPSVAAHPGADAWSYLTYPGRSVAGDQFAAARLAPAGEQDAFLGWPLMIVIGAGVIWLWRSLAVRVLAIGGVIIAALSLGDHIVVRTHDTHVPGPFLVLSKLPVFGALTPARFALVVLPIVAALGALIADRVVTAARDDRATRLLAVGTAAAVLVPIAPMPLVTARAAGPQLSGAVHAVQVFSALTRTGAA